MKLAAFIDYDNLLPTQTTSGVLSIITKCLMGLPISLTSQRGSCEIRVYGGWYEGKSLTVRAQDLSSSLANEFPALIRVEKNDIFCGFSTQAELAFSLIKEPNNHLFGSYQRKGKPSNIKIETPDSVGCADVNCLLKYAKKLLKTGSCQLPSCLVVNDSLVYRNEQKTVDTLLACDLIYASQLGYDALIVLSGDNDFLPPLRMALLNGVKVFRIHPRSGYTPAAFLATPPNTAQLVEQEL